MHAAYDMHSTILLPFEERSYVTVNGGGNGSLVGIDGRHWGFDLDYWDVAPTHLAGVGRAGPEERVVVLAGQRKGEAGAGGVTAGIFTIVEGPLAETRIALTPADDRRLRGSTGHPS